MGLALRLELAYRGLTLRLKLAYRGLALRLKLAYRGLWWVLGDIQCEHFTQIGDGGGAQQIIFIYYIKAV